MHPNTKKLRTLMKRHKITAADVAKKLSREVNTVRIWRMENTTRVIPNDTLKVLALTLEPASHRGGAK